MAPFRALLVDVARIFYFSVNVSKAKVLAGRKYFHSVHPDHLGTVREKILITVGALTIEREYQIRTALPTS